MRVVAGSARGRRLVAPPGDATRPTSDRVREAIFNALWSRGAVVDATVLDLFAGSGAMGIEALSRGAAHATFVDDDGRARRVISDNLATCGLADRADVVADKAERFVERSPGQAYDVVFCDPPYAFGDDEWTALLGRLDTDLAVLESNRELELSADWEVLRAARYGRTWVTLGAKRSPRGGGE
jgi:16S rRNA (guanine966-N2)-methyltransferase